MSAYSLYFAWVVSLTGAILSLYFGEVQQIPPCPLCWYQRIALFPLAVILGIASYRSDLSIRLYALPLSIVGFLIALYQALSIHFPVMQSWLACGKECAEEVFLFGSFVTFPDLSAIGFALICFFLIRSHPEKTP